MIRGEIHSNNIRLEVLSKSETIHVFERLPMEVESSEMRSALANSSHPLNIYSKLTNTKLLLQLSRCES